jgi:hypothetical protein
MSPPLSTPAAGSTILGAGAVDTDWFRVVAEPGSHGHTTIASAGTPDRAAVAAVFEKYGMMLLGPPLSAD